MNTVATTTKTTSGDARRASSKSMQSYLAARQNTPRPGEGCHPYLMRLALLGLAAGFSPDELVDDILAAIPIGDRVVSRREVADTVAKASQTATQPHYGTSRNRPFWRPSPDFGKAVATLEGLGHWGSEVDFFHRSRWALKPYCMHEGYRADAVQLLRTCPAPDLIFCGEPHDTGPEFIRPAAEWADRFEAGHPIPSLWGPNPFTGNPAPTADGKQSYRSDAAIAVHRFALIEIDQKPLEQQYQLIAGLIEVGFPIASVCFSGGKSLHALVVVDAADANEWQRHVKPLYRNIFGPIGADPCTSNPSRLSRLPGHFRAEKSSWQRLVYLNPEAGR